MTVPIGFNPDTLKPIVRVNISDTQFYKFSFLRISEYNVADTITIYNLSDLIPSNFTNTTYSAVYYYVLPNKALLNISLQLYLVRYLYLFLYLDTNRYATGLSVLFANQTIVLPANSVKFTCTIRNWNFATLKNTLEIAFKLVCRISIFYK